MIQAVENINIASQEILITPKALKEKIQISDAARKTITDGRNAIENILDRKDKMGFPVPLKEWMQSGIVRDFVGDILLSSSSLGRCIFTPEALNRMLNHQGVGSRQLWGALSLELWFKNFID